MLTLSNPSPASIQWHIPSPILAEIMFHFRVCLGGAFCLFRGFFLLVDSQQGDQAFWLSLKGMRWPLYEKSAFTSVFSAGCNCSCTTWWDVKTKHNSEPWLYHRSSPNGALVFQCLVFIVIIPGKNKIQLFAGMSTQEYGQVLRAAGEEFLKSPWQLYTST